MTEPSTRPATPRWVKVFGAIALVVLLLFVVRLFGGEHGPGRHIPPDPWPSHADR